MMAMADQENQDCIRYYEFEIHQISEIKDYIGHKDLTFINIKDIT